MCIFTQPVISVSNTQIFSRLTSRGTQYLVYQMSLESASENAMVLPIPIRRPTRDESLRFINLRGYNDFFNSLDRGFPFVQPTFHIGCASHVVEATNSALEVFEVGNYVASFVPSLSDFSRIDGRFRLPASTWEKLPQYGEFGFAVFQLASGKLTPHPMALEFDSSGDSIYFPTMHIHDGEIHAREEFDHVLYLQHAGFDSVVYDYQNAYTQDGATGLVRSKNVANRFMDIRRAAGIVDGDLLVHRKIIREVGENRDVNIVTAGHPEVPGLNLRPLQGLVPWVIFGGLLTWFFARRSRIKNSETKATDNGVEKEA